MDMQQASHRLLEQLDTYVYEDDAEAISVTLAKQMIMQHKDIWLQSCNEGHITGSGLILDGSNERVLLMYHRKLQLWLQMGGHGEGELDPSQIALREAIEEFALPDLTFFPSSEYPMFVDVDAHIIPARLDIPAHYHLDFRYLLLTSLPEDIRLPHAEAHDLRWYSFAEIPTLPLKPATLRLVMKAKRFLRKQDYLKADERCGGDIRTPTRG